METNEVLDKIAEAIITWVQNIKTATYTRINMWSNMPYIEYP